MPSLQPVKSRGKTYWRIVESRRINGKPRAIPIVYLGSVENLLGLLDAGSVVSVKSCQHGDVAALKAVADKLGVAALIDKHVGPGVNGVSIGKTLILAAINRASRPRSKRGFKEWASETTLGKLFPHLNMKNMTSQFFWEQMDRVSENELELIEEELTAKLVKSLDLSLGTILYDVTNFFTYIASDNERAKLPKRGHNKQKRFDLRQFNLAVFMSRQGQIPLLSTVYDGNQPDVTRFEASLTAIRKRLEVLTDNYSQVTLVYDKGNNSIENQKAMDESEMGFIVPISPLHTPGGLMDVPIKNFDALATTGTLKGMKTYRMEKDIWGKKRTVIMFLSQKLKEGQQRGFTQDLEKALMGLQDWKQHLGKPNAGPRTMKAATLRIERILKGSFVKQVLQATYHPRRKGSARLSWQIDEKKKTNLEQEVFGRRIIMTNRHEWSTADIIDACHSQSDLENTYKQIKDPEHFAVRPQFHWTDQKIRVHVFICMLALLMGRLVEQEARSLGMQESLSHLMDQLSTIRLSVMIQKPKVQKKAKQSKTKTASDALSIQWMLEQTPAKIMNLFESLVPQRAPFVYTKSVDLSHRSPIS